MISGMCCAFTLLSTLANLHRLDFFTLLLSINVLIRNHINHKHIYIFLKLIEFNVKE